MHAALLACLAAAATACRGSNLHSVPLATHRVRHGRRSEVAGWASAGAGAGANVEATIVAAAAGAVPAAGVVTGVGAQAAADAAAAASAAAVQSPDAAAAADAAVPPAATPPTSRTLVIVTGQPRGGEAAWRSMQQHLLTPLNADLATYFTDAHGGTFIQRMAKFNWTCPEYDDWSFALDDIAASCGRTRSEWVAAFCTSRLDKQWWLGGATPECKQQGPQAAGMLMVYRWLVQKKIVELGLDAAYDHFVLTRADQLYLCDHVPVTTLDPATLFIVQGENYGGWTDRHVLGHRDVFLRGLSMTFEMFCNPDAYAALINYYMDAGLAANAGYMNIETLQKMVWEALDVTVATVPRAMFTVRAEGDPSKWSQGEAHASFAGYGLKIKYPDELDGARATCAAGGGVDVDAKLRSLHG